MGLKPDHWIRKMATEHRMIEPFEAGQVRNGVISYGVSSYGYDIRVADEYKIFTNVYSAIVDPKNFDPRSMVDFKGDVCVIPPNSFVLTRTVEYFRIPRGVLTLCIGKSTYARCGLIVNVTPFEPCYSDDTEILASDGWQLFQNVDIGDLVLTMRKDGIAEWQHISRKQVYEYEGDMIHFDGKSIDLLVTPDHKILVRRRTTKYQPQGSYNYKTDWYTVEAKEVIGRWNYEMSRKVIWEGKDVGNKVTIGGDDFPTNAFLEFLGYYIGDGSSYISKGGYLIQLAAFKPSSIKCCTEMLNRLGIKYSRQDTGFCFFSKPLFSLVNPLGHSSEKYIPKWVKELPPHRLERLIWGLIRSDGNIETQTYTTASKRLADDVQEIAFKAGYSAIVRNVGKSKDREWRGHIIKSNYDIHKVRLTKKQLTPKIRPTVHKTLAYKGYIYDVTVPNHIIFVRRNGKAVWSGNCWEGYVTLEISNTTPLPAKIYSNEGIAQVLFFEADEECEISYADKKGKYQRQQSIVLPRI